MIYDILCEQPVILPPAESNEGTSRSNRIVSHSNTVHAEGDLSLSEATNCAKCCFAARIALHCMIMRANWLSAFITFGNRLKEDKG